MATTSADKPTPAKQMDSLQKLGAASTAYTRARPKRSKKPGSAIKGC